jgi:membrane protease YdiL (CAAX protease family)
MNPMRGTLRGFWLTLAIVWGILILGGSLYARYLEVPGRIAAPVIAAFLWEASFYLVPGFESVRAAIQRRWRPPVLALGIVASALAPYCAYTVPTGTFHWAGLGLLVSLAAAASFCYLCLPANGYTDTIFLMFMAAVVLCGAFPAIYPSPAPGVRLEILGQMMWTRTGVMVILWFRRAEGIGFGFLPTAQEWSIGLRNYLYFLPVGMPLALSIGLIRFRPLPLPWWMAAAVGLGTFLGMLWVVALAEEFFFRGLVQQWLSRRLDSRVWGVVLASVAFGLVHLPFRAFPNWRFALVAAVAGLFYGRAYSQAGGIRAAMIAHALVNTTTRMLFPYV